MSNSQWNPLLNGTNSSLSGFGAFSPMCPSYGNPVTPTASNGFSSFGQFSSRPSSTSDNFFQQPRSSSSSMGHFMAGGGVQSPPSPPSMGHFHIGTFNPNAMYGEEPSPRPPANTLAQSRRDFGASSPSNYNPRETGIIEKLLHSYGFIQCCERQARLFFHFSQFDGNVDHLKIGDPVEFEVTYDRRNGKPIASLVSKIAPEVVLSEERVTGTVTNELVAGSGQQGRISYENRGECFFLPFSKDDVEGNVTLRLGDKVSFQIATSHSGNLGARYIRLENPAMPVRYQGVVCSLKESFGFIERADVVREIFFHFSEAKGVADTLRVGDDVEFTIQTKNGKEVACNITILPPGTVVFEDVNPEVLKGQVLKPLERGVAANLNVEPLSGRLRYRGQDRSEVEIPFGDKDQKGEYTLRHGDWVQFNIAVDRRDKLQRATNIELLDESFEVSGEKRETGIVATIKEGYGFIRCAERDARVFFHFSEIVNMQETIDINSEVEFTITQDQSQPSKQSAIRIKILPTGTVQFEVIIQRNMVGTVTREPPTSWNQRSPNKYNGEKAAEDNGVVSVHNNGIMEHVPFTAKECDIRNAPRLGDEVEFDLAQCKRNKELIALNIRVVQKAALHVKNGKTNAEKEEEVVNGDAETPQYKGYIAALKDSFGFIETCTHDKEIFFHYSNFEGNPEDLELGQEVQYSVTSKNQPTGKVSAENVKVIPKGSIPSAPVEEQILEGVVLRPLRSVNPDQATYAGLLRQGNDVDGDGLTYEFGITSLVNKKEFLQRGDPVQFQVELCGERRRATQIRCVRRKVRSTVDAIKGQFGFLNFEVEEGKKLFFHLSEVKDGSTLQPGDAVEFVIITNQRSGKSSACHVSRVESQRPDWLISRMRTVSMDEQNGPRLTVLRQPKGPDGTRGFKAGPSVSGAVVENAV